MKAKGTRQTDTGPDIPFSFLDCPVFEEMHLCISYDLITAVPSRNEVRGKIYLVSEMSVLQGGQNSWIGGGWRVWWYLLTSQQTENEAGLGVWA